jgi:hypothetical protein
MSSGRRRRKRHRPGPNFSDSGSNEGRKFLGSAGISESLAKDVKAG